MKNLICTIIETIAKQEVTNDLLYTSFTFTYGDAAAIAPHIITNNADTYKVSRTIVGAEARNYLNNILDGYYENINYSVVYPD